MYKFSAPMPYSKEDIDKILDINKEVERSKITSLYACVPRGCEMFTGFEQSRNYNFANNDWQYWKGLIEYTLSKNCEFIYLLNSPRPLDIESHNFLNQLKNLKKLLYELKEIGVKKLRVGSVQLQTYISNEFPHFDILASTSLEYKTIWEYQNFIAFHPEITEIVPSHDINKNFKLLHNLRKSYPNIKIELIVNEGCLQGCPHRLLHQSIDVDNKVIYENNYCLSNGYASRFCWSVVERFPIPSLSISTNIFPWELKEYKKIGIDKFKLVGRDTYHLGVDNRLKNLYIYLKCIDDLKYVEEYSLSAFFHHLSNFPFFEQITIKNYKKYLPKISYFKKYGHLCASRCGFECKYCYKCAEKIQKVYEKKMKDKEKQPHFVPACKMAT